MPITVLDPTAGDAPPPARLAPRRTSLAGTRVGLLDNGKVNVEALQPIIDFWIQTKAVQEAKVDAKSLLDSSFAEAAAAKLPKYQ